MTDTQSTQVPVTTTFKERIKGLSRKEMTAIAKEEFQLNVDSNVKVETLRDTLQRYHEDRVTSAMEQNQAAAQVFLEANPDEKLLTVQFLPLDFPNNPLKFSNDCGYGIRDRKNPTKNPTGLSRMPTFFLIPRETYQLPLRLIKILESKVFSGSQPEFDTESGMIAGNIPVIKQRFMLRAVLPEHVMENLGTRKFS